MVLWVVDAHTSYQAGLNIESLKSEGYSAIVVKATQGSAGYWAPATFDNWIARARGVELVPGAYHWLNNTDPATQVGYFLNRLSAVGGPEGLIAAVDCEDTSSPASQTTVRVFVQEWFNRTGGHPLLFYSGAWWYQPHLDGFDVASLGVVGWHSHYVSGSGYGSVLYEKVPASWWNPGYGGFARARMLQFSDSGTTGGITANVDMNAFDGTIEDLRALTAAGQGIGPSPEDGRMGMNQHANQPPDA